MITVPEYKLIKRIRRDDMLSFNKMSQIELKAAYQLGIKRLIQVLFDENDLIISIAQI